MVCVGCVIWLASTLSPLKLLVYASACQALTLSSLALRDLAAAHGIVVAESARSGAELDPADGGHLKAARGSR